MGVVDVHDTNMGFKPPCHFVIVHMISTFVVVVIVELHEMMPYSLGMIWSSFLFLNLWSLVPSKCPHIIYDFGVESPKESIGELSFAIGTLSGNDIFRFLLSLVLVSMGCDEPKGMLS